MKSSITALASILGLAMTAMPIVSFALPTTAVTNKIVQAQDDGSEFVPFVPVSSITYEFDESLLRSTLSGSTQSIGRIKCDASRIFSSLGLDAKLAKRLTSVGLTYGAYDYSVDVRNCSLYGSLTNIVTKRTEESQTSFPESDAKKILDAFMKDFPLTSVMGNLGDPILTGQSVGDFPVNPVRSSLPAYSGYSYTFPVVYQGKKVYSNYGSPIGLTVEVSKNGVTSFNAQLIPFTIARVNSEKATADEIVKMVKSGVNGGFYSEKNIAETVKLGSPERVWVYVNTWKDNRNNLFLTTGTRLVSDRKQTYATQNYAMIVSDYKIGNNTQVIMY